MIPEPDFAYPDEILLDPQSGYAINLPVYVQDYPGWWNDKPDVYARLRQLRKDHGVSVVDFPDGQSQPPTDQLTILPMEGNDPQ